MLFRWLADAVVVLHCAFVLFIALGGFLALRWPRAGWAQLPSAAWGVFAELSDVACPLTPLENWLRVRGAEAAYPGSFVEHHLLPALYPAGLTRRAQLALGAGAVAANLVAYGIVLVRRRQLRAGRS